MPTKTKLQRNNHGKHVFSVRVTLDQWVNKTHLDFVTDMTYAGDMGVSNAAFMRKLIDVVYSDEKLRLDMLAWVNGLLEAEPI